MSINRGLDIAEIPSDILSLDEATELFSQFLESESKPKELLDLELEA